MTSPRELQEAVQASPGCSLVGLRSSKGSVPEGRVICKNGWGAAKFLFELCKRDASEPAMGDIAKLLRERSGGSDEEFAKMLVQFVQDNVAFVREEGEIFQGPAFTLREGYGDCDDHVRLIYGIARAGGLHARLAFFSQAGGNPSHVVAQLGMPEGWTWAETTLRASLGENPIDAAKRLGAVRPDLDPRSIDVQTMGGLEGLTDRISDESFRLLADWEKATGGNAEEALALMMQESGLNPSVPVNWLGCAGVNQFCPGTLETYYSGTAEDFRKESSEVQIKAAIHFWNDLNKSHRGVILTGRDLYWANFLPATVRPGAPDSYVIAGPGMMISGMRGETIVSQNASLSGDGRTITAGDLARVIAKQKTKAKYKEAVERLAKARGGHLPSPILVAGGPSFLAGVVVVLAMGGAGFLAAQKLRL